MARKKKKGISNSKALERVYLILTLAAVAGVAVFLGYIVGLYAIQAATGALNREMAQESRVVEETARRRQFEPPGFHPVSGEGQPQGSRARSAA